MDLIDNVCVLARNLNYVKRVSSSISFSCLSSARDETGLLKVTGSPPLFQAGKNCETLLHSSRDAQREAERQVKAWTEQKQGPVSHMMVVLGFAGMHHLLPLSEHLAEGGIFVVIDVIPEIMKEALRHCDLDLFSSRVKKGASVIFIVSENFEQARREFRHYIKTEKNLDIDLFVHPGLRRAFPEIYSSLLNEIKAEIDLELMDRCTRIASSAKWLQNAIANLPYILTSPPIDVLKGCFAGKTAIVAAAGPSLNDALPFIKKARKNCVLFCVGTALKPLLRAGVDPDFVVSIDSDQLVQKQFEGVGDTNAFLLASIMGYHGILESGIFSGKTFFLSMNALSGFEKWLKTFGAMPGVIPAGGTVALSALDIARYTGCSKIIFSGLDLAVLEDGTSHAASSMYEKENSVYVAERIVKGNYQDKVHTTKQFASYIKMLNSYLEDVLREHDILFYNATTGGAKLEHVELVHPHCIPELVSEVSGGFECSCFFDASKTDALPGKAEALGAFDCAIQELNEVSNISKSLLAACDVTRGNVNCSSKLKLEFDRLESELKSKRDALLLIDGAIQGMSSDIFSAESDSERLEKQSEFYKQIEGASGWTLALLTASKEEYKKMIDKKL